MTVEAFAGAAAPPAADDAFRPSPLEDAGRTGTFQLVYALDFKRAYQRRTETIARKAVEWAIREGAVPKEAVRSTCLGIKFAVEFDRPYDGARALAEFAVFGLASQGCEDAGRVCWFNLDGDSLARERETAVATVLHVVRERLDRLELQDLGTRAVAQNIVVQGALRAADDLDRVKAALAASVRLEFRIVSNEKYVSPDVVDFVTLDSRFQGRISLYQRGGERHLEATDGDGATGKDILETLVEAYASSLESRGDAAGRDVWDRVFVGAQDAPSLPPSDSPAGTTAPARWRTWLLEPEPLVTGERVVNAAVRLDPDAVRDPIYVILDFDAEGADQFGKATEANVRRSMAVVLDGTVRSAPTILEPIRGGTCRITLGTGSPAELMREAEALVVALKQGDVAASLLLPPLSELVEPL
ncbi:MAG: hypothetical protein HY905_08445 [Deltaproteobacteria bacterium]|nr:hypothetical protein [Deltaproteobacteria bacterium]